MYLQGDRCIYWILWLWGVIVVLAQPGLGFLDKRQQLPVFPPNEEGIHDGFYYTLWSDGNTNGTYTNLSGGSYSLE